MAVKVIHDIYAMHQLMLTLRILLVFANYILY